MILAYALGGDRIWKAAMQGERVSGDVLPATRLIGTPGRSATPWNRRAIMAAGR